MDTGWPRAIASTGMPVESASRPSPLVALGGPMALALGHPVGHPGPAPPGHSRESGNPLGVVRITGPETQALLYRTRAVWIPAFAGMTGWPWARGWPGVAYRVA